MKNIKAVFHFEKYMSSNGHTRTATVTWVKKDLNDGFSYNVDVNVSNGAGCSLRMRGTPAIAKSLRAITCAKLDEVGT